MNTKIKLLLTLSIILNFLFVGLLIGNASKNLIHEKDDKNHFLEITKKLPPEKQKLVMEKFDALKSERDETKAQIYKTRMEIAEILKAPEFDQKLYDKKISKMHRLYRGKAKKLANTIKELAIQFTPEERAVLAEMLEKKHKSKWHKDKNH